MKIKKELVFIFEHLLFEGTENIKRGEWFKIVTGNGTNNANTSDDRTLLKYSHLIILNWIVDGS
jgi:predicted Zn-dependent peptidase